jgi:peptidoglycan hydrolase-like protein with peptidoglycan-binding domain
MQSEGGMPTGSHKTSGIVLALALLFDMQGAAVRAETAAPQRNAPGLTDPAFEAARNWFESLPLAERRAIQDALVWTGDYKGTTDGNSGKRTRDAIAAFAARAKKPVNGTLDPPSKAALLAIAEKARASLRFASATDPRTGIQIGVPQKLMTKSRPLGPGTIWEAADGSASLRTDAASEADLAALYARTLAAFPGGRPTYKVLRPDFFVLTGEDAGRTTFTRYGRGVVNGQSVLRGFTLTYATAAKTAFDNIAIAIANSFDPFPAAGPTPQPAASGVAAPQSPPAPQNTFVATGVSVAPGLVLTSYASCANPALEGRPATVRKREEVSGLTLLESAAIKPQRLAPIASAGDATEALVLALTPRPDPAAPGKAPGIELQVSAARLIQVGNKPRVAAALQQSGAGAAIFSRAGELVGFAMLPPGAGPRLVAGIVPETTYPLAIAASLVPGSGPKSGDKTAGEIAATYRQALVSVTCSTPP